MVDYPKTNDPIRSKIMKSNRGKNTKLELRLRGALVSAGISGFRLHWKEVPGSPDIAFPAKKIAIFVNGCFWHRCPNCKPKLPRTNRNFWQKKFDANRKRDKLKIEELQNLEWKALVFWGCEIKNDLENCKGKVIDIVG